MAKVPLFHGSVAAGEGGGASGWLGLMLATLVPSHLSQGISPKLRSWSQRTPFSSTSFRLPGGHQTRVPLTRPGIGGPPGRPVGASRQAGAETTQGPHLLLGPAW